MSSKIDDFFDDVKPEPVADRANTFDAHFGSDAVAVAAPCADSPDVAPAEGDDDDDHVDGLNTENSDDDGASEGDEDDGTALAPQAAVAIWLDLEITPDPPPAKNDRKAEASAAFKVVLQVMRASRASAVKLQMAQNLLAILGRAADLNVNSKPTYLKTDSDDDGALEGHDEEAMALVPKASDSTWLDLGITPDPLPANDRKAEASAAFKVVLQVMRESRASAIKLRKAQNLLVILGRAAGLEVNSKPIYRK
jgi:hypothetical protein